MDPAEFVVLSGKLVAMGKPGARSAVSRAYYGSFHKALKLLAEVASAPAANSKSHILSVEFLKSANHPEGTAAGRLLGDLHSDRLKCDYDLANESVETQPFAMIAVETAAEFDRRLVAFFQICKTDNEVLQNLKNGIAGVIGRRRT